MRRWRALAAVLLFSLQAESRWLPINKTSEEDEGVVNSGRCKPERVHLALVDSPRELRVSWTTSAPGCSSRVHFGEVSKRTEEGGGSSDQASHLRSAADVLVTETFGPGDFCGEPASEDNFQPPNLQSAILTGLEPGRLYDYRIGHHEAIRQFRAPPEKGPDARFSFIAYADVGESVHTSAKSPGAEMTAQRVSDEVLNRDAELVVHVGDLSYADGKLKIWDTFLDQIEPYASKVPYQIAIGNHEYGYSSDHRGHRHDSGTDPSGRSDPYQPDWGNFGNDSGGECGVVASKLFLMPGSQAPEDALGAHHRSNPPFWFSYDYGNVHFATISTEHDLSHGSAQRKWLARDLAAVDRCITPWIVLLSHRPMYVVHPHKSNRVVGDHIRNFVEPLLSEYGVDLVLSGHIHAYARTCEVFEEQCVKHERLGVVHVTLGCGGRKLSSVQHTQPDWLEYAEREFGYGRIRVDGSRSLAFEYVHSEDGKAWDSFTIAPKLDALSAKTCMRNAAWNSNTVTGAAEKLPSVAISRLLQAANQCLPLTSLTNALRGLSAMFKLR